MFVKVLPEKGLEVISLLAPRLEGFYLAGGPRLALQLGHRISKDFDFFTTTRFNVDLSLSNIPKDRVIFAASGTCHVELKDIRVSFFYNEPGLIFPPMKWRGISVADVRNITAEKIKGFFIEHMGEFEKYLGINI